MKQNIENETIELLDSVQRVEAPPFLLTRIRQQINEREAPKVPSSLVWATGVSFVLILMLNVYTITDYKGTQTGAVSSPDIVEILKLHTNNALYN